MPHSAFHYKYEYPTTTGQPTVHRRQTQTSKQPTHAHNSFTGHNPPHVLALPQSQNPKTPTTPTSPINAPKSPENKKEWCVPKAGVSIAQLQANLDYVCGHGVDCNPIQPGGTCFEPNTVVSHAAYAMNLYYQSSGRNPWNCDFSQTATLSYNNPSYNGCNYPGEST